MSENIDPLGAEEKVIRIRCAPNPNADGLNDNRLKQTLNKRHPFLTEHTVKVKNDEVVLGYGHTAWRRLAAQLRAELKVDAINMVLEMIAIEGSDPELNVMLSLEELHFTKLLENRALQCNVAKVLEQICKHLSGRSWCQRIGVPAKLAAILGEHATGISGKLVVGSSAEDDLKVLYAVAKALRQWTRGRDALPLLAAQGVPAAIVSVLSALTTKTDQHTMDYLPILELMQALGPLTSSFPMHVVESKLIGDVSRFMERVFGEKAYIPNRDGILEACLCVLTQAGNTTGGRDRLMNAEAEGICSRLVFESACSRVQDAATGACSVLSLHKGGKARLESFLMANNFSAFVAQLANTSTSRKLKLVQSLAAKPSFKTSFIRQAIHTEQIKLIEDVFGVSGIATAFRLLEEMPGKVLSMLHALLAGKEPAHRSDGGADYISIAILIGVPVLSPAQVAYETCVDIVPALARHYSAHRTNVMACILLLAKDEKRFTPVLKLLVANPGVDAKLKQEIAKIMPS